jgi:hypothetical protein
MKKNYLEMAKRKRQTKNKITQQHLRDLHIDDLKCLLYCECDPASYGKWMEKKLEYDTNYLIRKISASKDCGEFNIGGKISEMKTTYLNMSGVYRLANVRPWQKIDYYVLFLIDCENDFQLRVFMVSKEFLYGNLKFKAMDNPQSVNDNNDNVNVGTTFKPSFITELEKVNILRGSTYDDLKDYIYYMNNHTKQVSVKSNKKTSNSYRNKMTKVSFKLNGNINITGNSNIEVVSRLCSMIGYKNIVGAMWDSQISKVQTELFKVDIGGGYFLNPKFSIRDIRNNINNINKKKDMDIKLIES